MELEVPASGSYAILSGSANVIVQLEPKASYPGYITFIQDDHVVGKVDAVFDFTDMPKCYHELAIGMIRGHRVKLPTLRGLLWIEQSDGPRSAPEPTPVKKKDPWWKIW